MTATAPTPRTLAMDALSGDLDSCLIEKLPPGRQSPSAPCTASIRRARVFGFMEEEDCQGVARSTW
jgi:RecG-like helicase